MVETRPYLKSRVLNEQTRLFRGIDLNEFVVNRRLPGPGSGGLLRRLNAIGNGPACANAKDVFGQRNEGIG